MIAQPRLLGRTARFYGSSPQAPPAALEGAYYAYLFYISQAPELGLLIPRSGLGLLLVLAGCCLLHRGANATELIKSIRLPLAFALSFLFVRLLVHGDSLSSDYPSEVPVWICTLVVAHALCLRPGFLQRFPAAMVAIALPSLRSFRMDEWGTTGTGEEIVRAGALGPLRNSNGMAFWFGFCCIYFVVLGLETRRMSLRLAAWAAALACLFLVGMTVSRGTLLSVAICVAIALRRLLKRSFFPLLLLLIGTFVIYLLGIFDRAADSYAARGLEDTGRVAVWPVVIDRFWDSPLYGVRDIATYAPGHDIPITPHNGFLFIALATGIVPLLLFVAYCGRAVIGVWRAHHAALPDALFLLPLFVFVFISAQTTNMLFSEFTFVIPFAAALRGAERHMPIAVAHRRPFRGRYGGRQPGLRVPHALR